MSIIHVAVAGASGKLGSIAAEAVRNAAGFEYAGGLARKADPAVKTFASPDELLARKVDVLFDALTLPASFDVTMKAVAAGARPVIGTSGWDAEQRAALAKRLEEKNLGGLIVPNFSLGAILMMRFAEAAAPLFSGVEIVEMHRASKKDKPSGTAAATAARIAARRNGEVPPIHSVRLPGLLAHQEVHVRRCRRGADDSARFALVRVVRTGHAARGQGRAKRQRARDRIGLGTILMSKLDVAVVGATGVVGETILRVLEERGVPVGEIAAFASRARTGAVRFRGETLDVRATDADALQGFEVVFFASGEDSSERYAPALVRARIVRDRQQFHVPHAGRRPARHSRGEPRSDASTNIACFRSRTAPPSCCVPRCVRFATLRGSLPCGVATYQAASGAGRAGLDEFLSDERAVVLGEEEPAAQIFPQHLAHNVIPQIGSFDASGYSGEERKVAEETRKMLSLPELFVSATTVRVPVRTAHSEAVFFKTERKTRCDRALGKALAVALRRRLSSTAGSLRRSMLRIRDLVHVARRRAEK